MRIRNVSTSPVTAVNQEGSGNDLTTHNGSYVEKILNGHILKGIKLSQLNTFIS